LAKLLAKQHRVHEQSNTNLVSGPE
jgi:hypothetical protein